VYCAGSLAHGNGNAPTRVRGAWRREFDGSSESARDPALRAYVTDMVRPYGLSVRDDLLEQGSGQSYAEMAGTLLADTVSAEQPVDLLVLAFAVSDTLPGRSSASYLSHVCPGDPMAFAICDQGSAAPFTGLRLISEYARSGDCSRALLVIAEQATLHHDLGACAVVPAKNAVVALLCAESGPGRVDAVRLTADVEPPSVPVRLAADLAVLSGGRDDVTVIAGGGIVAGGPRAAAADESLGIPAADQVIAAPAGQPCTGVWWEFAGCLPEWTASGRRVLLADYDRLLGTLCVAAIDVQPLVTGHI
jgi:4-hydroxymandelate oxidase